MDNSGRADNCVEALEEVNEPYPIQAGNPAWRLFPTRRDEDT